MLQVKAVRQVSDRPSITTPGCYSLGLWDAGAVEKAEANYFLNSTDTFNLSYSKQRV